LGGISKLATQTPITEKLMDYVREVSLRENELLRNLREETVRYPMGATMQVMAEEGQLLEFLARTVGARNALELGTFTGYSALCIAKGLTADGQLITCDSNKKWPEIGKPYWEEAGLGDVIESRIGDAEELLIALLSELGSNYMDLIFVDADKSAYKRYYELGLDLLRVGGIMLLDNTLYFGRVADSSINDRETVAIRDLNIAIHRDDRVDLVVIPMADGITMVRKK
jgi:O-methyltransferase